MGVLKLKTGGVYVDISNIVGDHNYLDGLQGGSASEYYHISVTTYNALTDAHAQLTALHTDTGPTFDHVHLAASTTYGIEMSGNTICINGGLNVGGTTSATDNNLIVTGVVMIGKTSITSGFSLDMNTPAKFGGTSLYINPSNPNTFNCHWDTDSEDQSFWINYVGYAGGTTRRRDLYIGDGKGAEVAHFDGSSTSFYVTSDCSALTFTDRV